MSWIFELINALILSSGRDKTRMQVWWSWYSVIHSIRRVTRIVSHSIIIIIQNILFKSFSVIIFLWSDRSRSAQSNTVLCRERGLNESVNRSLLSAFSVCGCFDWLVTQSRTIFYTLHDRSHWGRLPCRRLKRTPKYILPLRQAQQQTRETRKKIFCWNSFIHSEGNR